MAAPPNDWGAIRSRWTKIADASCMDDADLIFGARPSGVGAPFLESEELKRNGSERVALLDVSLVMTLSVPRVWSQEWIEARDAEHLWPREMMIESALSECGFESVMPLGRIFTCSGPDYWANVANRERGRWEALDQARVLNAELPEAPSQGSRAL